LNWWNALKPTSFSHTQLNIANSQMQSWHVLKPPRFA
jgi:hypothetical protein